MIIKNITISLHYFLIMNQLTYISDTIVWNKQNFMNRIVAPPKHHKSNLFPQARTTEVWSKPSYDFHRKHHPSYNSTSQTEFLSDRINESLDNSTLSPNYNFSPIKYSRVTANGISQLLQIDSNKRINQQNSKYAINNTNDTFIHSFSNTSTTPLSPIITSTKVQEN